RDRTVAGVQTCALPISLPKEIHKDEVIVSPEIRPAQVIVSPDQSRFGWISRNENSFSVVVDGKEQKPYDWIIQGKVDFTGDSKRSEERRVGKECRYGWG